MEAEGICNVWLMYVWEDVYPIPNNTNRGRGYNNSCVRTLDQRPCASDVCSKQTPILVL